MPITTVPPISMTDESSEDFKINEKYIKKYETTKRNEEIKKLEQKYTTLEESSSSDTSQQIEEDTKVLNLITQLKKKDKNVLLQDRPVFDEKEEKSSESDDSAVLLKDYHRKKNLCEIKHSSTKLIYNDEQAKNIENLKKEFEDEESEEILLKKEKEEYKNLVLQKLTEETKEEIQNTENKEDKFLLNYILNRKWKQNDSASDSSSDIEVTDNYKDVPKNVTSLREPKQKKKKSILRKKAAEQSSRKKREEEIKRLKNLKKKQFQQRIKTIEQLSGLKKEDLECFKLGEDFDEEEFNKQVENVFNEEYYSLKEKKPKIVDDNPDVEEIIELENKIDQIQKISRELKSISKEYKEANKAGDFSYISVRPLDYGLTAEDILFTDDKILRSHVSVKNLAPYKDPEYEMEVHRKIVKERRLKEFHNKKKGCEM